MGADQSKGLDGQIYQIFTEDEQQKIHKLYSHIVGSQRHMTEPFLEKYLASWFDLNAPLFYAICNCQLNEGHVKDRHVTEIHFAGFLAQCLKGTPTERADIVCLLSGRHDGSVSVLKLHETIVSVIKSYLLISEDDGPRQTWKSSFSKEDISRLALNFLSKKTISDIKEGSGEMDQNEVEKYLTNSPMFMRMFDRLFYHLFPVIAKDSVHSITQSLMPVASNVEWKKTHTILDTLSITYINNHLPREHQSIWRLLYSNSLHGDSFAQLTRFVIGKGPNVLIVKDKDGHVFGAYVSQSWEIKPTFYGSSDCFLFLVKPYYGVYTSTGYNTNYMYFNQGQETLPNGLGLGGQLQYFGLWIDNTFNDGHSKAVPKCTTYGSPQLSANPEFHVDGIEVWAVGPEKKKEQDSDEEEFAKTSILDKDMEAKAILELAGRKQHSEGIRDLTEEEPPMTEEMKKKMNTIPKMF